MALNYNPYGYGGNIYPSNVSYGVQDPQSYMISVDGESAARAWQQPGGQPLPPNAIVPLFDLDGEHIYFKTTDMYGRINPIRKGRVVFEEMPKNLSQGQSGASQQPTTDPNQYVTKDDFATLEQEIRSLKNMLSQNNQNGRRYQQENNNNRGENR